MTIKESYPNKPLVSIALCTYNGETHLIEQLDSLVSQSYTNLEIVVVDDSSKDNTLSILESYYLKYPNLKVFQNENNVGFIKNFEIALSYCSGEFIAFSDQDDIWHPDKIKLLIENINDNQLIYHDSELINEHGDSMNLFVSDVRKFYRGEDCRYFLLENCISGHASLFRKTLISHLMPFPKNIYHDRWLAFIAASHGSIDYLEQPLVKYRQHQSMHTDILMLKTTKATSNRKTWDDAERITVLAQYNGTSHQPFIKQLALLMVKKTQTRFSFNLFFFMLRYQHILLYIRKKPLISKLNYCLKCLWGYQIKG